MNRSRTESSDLPYDPKSESSILKRGQAVVGLTITDVLAQALLPSTTLHPKDKGKIGGIIQECWFGIPCNNRPEPDFNDAGIELKIIPLETGTKKGLRVKERTKVCAIEYVDLARQEWLTSHAKIKLNKILFVYYIYDKANPERSVIKHCELWKLDDSLSKRVITDDWIRVRNKVKKGEAHELSESQSNILGASTTGQGHGRDMVSQPMTKILAKKRAFSLKPSFTNQLWAAIQDPTKFESIVEVMPDITGLNFEAKILAPLFDLEGRSLVQIAEQFDIEPPKGKNAAATILKKALGFKHVNSRITEFDQFGLEARVIPIRTKDYRPWESTSFAPMDLKEFVIEEWEESSLQQYIDYILFIPVYRATPKAPMDEKRLGKSFFWRPSKEEWSIIEAEWRLFQAAVKEGRAKTRLIQKKEKIIRVSDLPKESDTRIIHMRPHGEDGDDMDVDHLGNPVVKQSFWLNKEFVHELVERSFRK
jgi:DNA mismatch repair protein MutH